MSDLSVHYSSKTYEHETPQFLFDKLDRQFRFKLDVCATPQNTKCSRYFTLADDGLKQPWSSANWMNPPYGREISKWIQRASLNPLTVALLPSRTDTRWFHNHIYANPKAEVHFLKGRLKFGAATNSAPFPSMIVIFR